MQAEDAEKLMSAAKSLRTKEKLEEAVEQYSQAEKIFAAQGDERGRTRAWSGIGKALFQAKDMAGAVKAYSEAATAARLSDWPERELDALYNKGLILERIGTSAANLQQVNAAIEAFQQALDVAQKMSDIQSVGVLLLSLGFNCAWAKRDEEAIAYFSEAMPFALDKADFETQFSSLSSLGVLLSNHNRANEAVPYFERALELAKSARGDIVAVADSYANLGIAYEKAGQLDKAIEAIATYRQILYEAGDVKAGDAAAMLKRLKNLAQKQK